MQHLFVYGSLKPDARGTPGVEERVRLAREGRWLGEALVTGILYDLGAYPGFVEGAGLVYGGVYALIDEAATFAWLDVYEGVGDAPDDYYDRRRQQATLADGSTIWVWAYVMRAVPAGSHHVASGRWSRPT